jgi:hypothetical protein
MLLSSTYLHTLKLSIQSAPKQSSEGIAGSLADTDISDLAFVDQFFKFLPRRVGVCSQRLINLDPPIEVGFLLECNRPVELSLSSLGTAKEASRTHQ